MGLGTQIVYHAIVDMATKRLLENRRQPHGSPPAPRDARCVRLGRGELRGPGELIGKRQSGVPMLRYADLERDADLIPTAQKIADQMLKESPALTDVHMDRWFGHAEGFLKT